MKLVSSSPLEEPYSRFVRAVRCVAGPEVGAGRKEGGHRRWAEWICNLVAEHFPDALQIVDLYHARRHFSGDSEQLYPNGEVRQKAWMKVHQKRLLDKGKIEKLVDVLRALRTNRLGGRFEQ